MSHSATWPYQILNKIENFSNNISIVQNRIRILKYILICVFAILGIRLFVLQIISHKAYLKASENNTYLNIKKSALRAQILDKNNELLAFSKPIFKLVFSGTNAELQYIKTILETYEYKPMLKNNYIIIKNLSWHDLSKIFAINSIPMPDIEIDQIRVYPFHESTSHVIGYLKNTAENEYIGINGVEKAYNDKLIGKPGQDIFLMNAHRKRLKKAHTTNAQNAQSLIITIDSRLQKAVHNALSEHIQGAIMIVDLANGEILAAASYPSFDNQYFTDKNLKDRNKILSSYQKNKHKPMFNLFLNCMFPPGSTIKPFMLLAMLKKHVPQYYNCTGIYTLGTSKFRCLSEHGHIHISKILPTSCNCAFYSFSQYLKQKDLMEIWQEFGLGQPILPEFTKIYPKFPYKKNWKKIDSLFMQIGQGASLVTLAQLVRAYSRLATGKKIELTFLKRKQPIVFPDLSIKKEHLNIVRKSLFDTINAPWGTAYGLYQFINAAGKTGTAQVLKMKEHEYGRSNLLREWKFRDHSLFCAYIPFDKPKICACSIIIHGGGSRLSASILLKLLDYALSLLEKNQAITQTEQAGESNITK